MSDVVDRIAELSPARRQLLAKLLVQKRSELTRTIPRRADSATCPLSFIQERLWFLDRLLPNSSMYTMAGAVRLIGALDPERVTRCFQEIIRRHEVLRTTFTAVDGHPVAVIADSLPFAPRPIDLRELPAAQRETAAQHLIAEEVRRPFDLEHGPLIRLTLLRVADNETIGLLTMHHIVADGWSTRVLFQEFVAGYQAFATDQPPSLPDLPIQYADFAAWQREQLQGERLATHLDYWRKQFGDSLPVLDLPTDHPRPAMPSFAGARQPVVIGPRLTQALRDLSQREGVTLFMTLLAAFKTLLFRYTRQRDLVVGIPIAERSHPELAGLIGCFLNMLALRTDMAGNPTFRELLRRVQQVALGAYAHQELPFEKLVDELQPERTMSHAPLCQVAFSFEENPAAALQLPGLTMQFAEFDTGSAKLDLGLELTQTRTADQTAQLDGWIEYSTDLFEPATIARMVAHLTTLLEGIATNPDQRLSDLPLLTADERRQLLVDWNNTAADYPQDVCIHQLFEAQAARTPDRTAIVFGATRLTYQELNTRANQLAHDLQARGIGPEVLVGICLERSPTAVIAILAVLKAGGAYVPLDPHYPASRLTFLLNDAQVALLLTEQAIAAHLPELPVPVLCLDCAATTIAQQPVSNPVSHATADNLAYVIYTSGSTGQPKGVTVAQRDLVHHTLAFVDTHALDADDQVLLFVSLSFDAAAAVLYPPLVIGATSVIPDRPSAELTGHTLTRFCEQHQITVAHFPASFWHQWVDDLVARGEPPRIPFKVLLTGGESPMLSKLQTWADFVGRPMRFLNAYGPTEAVITTTLFSMRCDPATVREITSIPAGRPIPNKRIYLLDDQMQPVPIGVPGEVYVGGIGLARGYFRHPETTAITFVPDPFSTRPGTRLYRTGDLAHYRTDGQIEFLGRVDQQVKLRGFRVELGEIEAVLSRHPAVQENVVTVRKTGTGSQQLVAYLVLTPANATANPAPNTVTELRRYMQQQLPDHMVPSAFVFLDSLPLTAHGKIDERVLPAPTAAHLAVTEHLPPRTPVEQEVCAIWAEILGVSTVGTVGINHNFFELGGHSLLATQIMSRIRDRFGVDLPLRLLFEGPTVANLAAQVAAAHRTQQDAATPPMVPVPREQPLPLSFAQQRLWFLNRMEPESAFYNMPAAVRLTGHLDSAALEQSLNQIIQRHETLRTTFAIVDDQPVQVIAPAQPIALPCHDLSGLPAAEQMARVTQMLTADARRPFDLEHGPLLRVTLVRLAAEEAIFLLNMHHIVSDDWSMSVFVRELGAFYQAARAGTQPDAALLPPLNIQYADFAVWQRHWLQGMADTAAPLQAQLTYWKQQLGGSLPMLDLPFDRGRPPVQTYRGARHTFALEQSLSQGIDKLSQREGVTPFMTLLAAFKSLLYRYTGQADLLVGTPIAGRNRCEIEGLIGFFINTLVLRTDMAGNPTFREVLRRVREVTLGAYAHQDLPFEKLVEELQPERDLSRPPIFQVLFVLHNAPATALEVPDLALTPLEVPAETALFDVTLSLTATEQGLTGWWEYNTDLFDAATIARMDRHYQTLLAGSVTDPAQRLLDLPLLSATEQQHLLALGTPAPAPYPHNRCIHELIAEQAARLPDAPAVLVAATAQLDAAPRLTYRELNERANQLAHHLRRLGVGPEVLVGIYVERSLEMLVGLLGILKAGGAYVPLDPAFPRERLAFMLADSQAGIILTQQQLLNELPEHAAHVICLDRDWPTIAAESRTDPPASATPDNRAYVLYTSGSTGRPKGVQISQRALINFLESMRQQPGLTGADVLVAVTTLSFDIAGLELYLPLMVGAQLVIASRAVAGDGPRLQALLRDTGATVMQATPATWRLLLEAGWSGSSTLNILCGGEAFPRDLADQLLERSAAVWNMYGPTETTIWSTVQRVGPGRGVVPIGKPIANTQVYLLDRQLRPVPQGVPGELYIGGDGLARDYLNRPELTAARFIPNPFSATPGARMYQTGDLARYLPDGSLEFFGRIDHQVKIRGFRIEVGEIEALLGRHPDIQQCVVVARELGANRVLVAYYIPTPASTLTVNALRRYLKEQLPDYMVPSAFVALETLPLTPNGKIDRRALPIPEGLRPELESVYVSPRNALEQTIAAIWQAVLTVERVGVNDNFFDLGGHSLLMAQVHSRLREQLDQDISMIDLFKYPTIGALARYLSPDAPPVVTQPGQERARLRRTIGRQGDPAIAIIGMTGRFPGAPNIATFWQNLRDGVESITFFTPEELLEAGLDPALVNHPDYVPANAILNDIDMFDAGLFGMPPKEAAITDPQHRLFLECSWEALECAGYDPERYPGRIGVYAGAGLNTYVLNNLYSNWNDLLQHTGFHQLLVANDKDFVPTRVSYKLNLRGPGINIQTACSTSLVAVHAACQSLRNGECDMALAGGVSIKVPQKEGYLYHEGGIPSPDGHCRAFDAGANGTIRGDGVAVVVLKRLTEALADGDAILAVIKGTAINNDGANKVGYTAPSVDGQAEVIAEALAVADVSPDTISYVETHGTGTPLGDPIEIAALTQAYRAATDKTGFCAIGSVKTNIGHLDTAAGGAGLIKTVLALLNQAIPPSLNVTQPNTRIDFARSPFVVNTQLTPWQSNGHPRRAGVSSFGIGGTNAHVILEEAPAVPPTDPARPWQMLLLSAQTATALETATSNLAAYLAAQPDLNIADVAFTLHQGRKQFAHRRVLVCRDREDAAAALAGRDPGRLLTGVQSARERPVVFMFSGQGAQYVNMARELYQHEEVFRQQVDQCTELLFPHLGLDLRTILYPEADAHLEELTSQLNQTWLTQPALFVIEYSLAQLWMAWGIRPQALIGHSIGEYVAACLAGVLTLADALALVAMRGRLMQEMPSGSMLTVSLPEAELLPLLGERLDLAAVNGASFCVVSGPDEAIAALEQQLIERGTACRRLHTSHAFHSAMMAPIVEPFAARIAQVQLNPPQLPVISNVTGTWLTAAEATDPRYWARHLRQPVRFADGMTELLADPERLLIEVGPGQTLATLTRQHPAKTAETLVLNSLRHPNDPQSDLAFLLQTLGRLWLAGATFDGAALYAGQRRRRVLLPTYPFERQRYWIEPQPLELATTRAASRTEKRPDLADWFYIPVWKPAIAAELCDPARLLNESANWLIFSDTCGLAPRLEQRLRTLGQEVITVSAGVAYAQTGETAFTINPRQPEDYARLFSTLAARDRLPRRIMHLWSVTPPAAMPAGPADWTNTQELGCYSLICLAQALGNHAGTAVQLGVFANGMQGIAGEPVRYPEKATLLGPCLVIPQEYPHVSCQSIDIELPSSSNGLIDELVEQTLEAMLLPSPERVSAYRHGQRRVQEFTAVRLEANTDTPRRLRNQGVYLITGGCGGMGLVLADYLAHTVQARLVLTSRTALPPRETWAEWLATHTTDERISQQLRQIQQLEERGAEVLVVPADVTNLPQMQAVIRQTLARFGVLHGVIHAAGILENESIRRKTLTNVERVLQPKVLGTLVLNTALHGIKLDWLLLTSSLTANIGGIQSVDYSAANAFLEAFSQSAACAAGAVISVNWDNWQEVGMAASSAVPEAIKAWHAEELRKGILPAEGVEVFSRIMNRPVRQVLVSTRDLPTRIAHSMALTADHPVAGPERPTQPAHARPSLASPYVAPRNEQEQKLAQICGTILGIDQVGIHDNFFELGCDSLIAIQLIARIKEEFAVQISPVTLFEAPTISALVAHLTPAPPEVATRLSLEESESRAEARLELSRRRQARRQRG